MSSRSFNRKYLIVAFAHQQFCVSAQFGLLSHLQPWKHLFHCFWLQSGAIFQIGLVFLYKSSASVVDPPSVQIVL